MRFLRFERGQIFSISARNRIIVPDFMTFNNSMYPYSMKTQNSTGKKIEFGISGLDLWYIRAYFGKSPLPSLAVKHQQLEQKSDVGFSTYVKTICIVA